MLEFTISGRFGPDEIVGLRAHGLRTVPARRTSLSRTWLDTADARLARRGLRLVHVQDGERRRLWLQAPTGTVSLPAGPVLPRWPADLPPAVRGRIAPVVGIRALLTVRADVVSASVAPVVNDDDKTVARLWMELPGDGSAALLRVEPLRGYTRQARRLAAHLSGDPRLAPLETGTVVVALPPAPPRPGRDVPATRALAMVLGHLLAAIESNVEGTLGAWDTEFLHDLRVAVRATRSALKLAAPVLPAAFAAGFGPPFRWLGDATTPSRDLDVMIAELPVLAAGLPAAAVWDLGPLRQSLAGQGRQAHAELGRALRSARFRRLVEGYGRALAQLAKSPPPEPNFGPAADAWVARALRQVVRQGRRSRTGSPEMLHDLRKRCKELRYCLELFGSAWEPGALQPIVGELKRLQDNLGTFQDSEVHRLALLSWAQKAAEHGSAPTATVLAVGRLAAQLEQRQAAARSDLAGRWAHFASPRNLRRFERLSAVPS